MHWIWVRFYEMGVSLQFKLIFPKKRCKLTFKNEHEGLHLLPGFIINMCIKSGLLLLQKKLEVFGGTPVK